MSVYPYTMVGGRPMSRGFSAPGQKAPKKTTGKKTTGSKTPPRTALTMEQWAEQQAERRISAEVAAIEEQRRIFEQERMANYQRKLEQAKALAQVIQGMGFDKAIQGVYSGAGSDLAGLASGFAGQTRDIASADAAAQMNMLSGTGQEGAVRDQGTNMGDVLYGVGGWIPGKALGEQGAAYAANAALQPAFTMQQGAAEAGRAFDEEGAALSDFAMAIAEAKAGKFSYKEELLAGRQKAALDQQKINIQRLEADRDFWLKRQALYLQRAETASSISARREATKLAKQAEKRANRADMAAEAEARGRDMEGNLLPGYWQDPKTGRVYTDDYVRKGNSIVKRSDANKRSPKPLTPSQRQEAVEAVQDRQEDIEGEIARAIRTKEWVPGLRPGDAHGRQSATKSGIARRLFAKYAHLATTPTAKKELRRMISQLLDEAESAGASGASGGKGASALDDILNEED